MSLLYNKVLFLTLLYDDFKNRIVKKIKKMRN